MYKPLSDSTLMGMTKKEIISCLRVAEHNYFAAKETFENHIKEVEKNYKYVVHASYEYDDEIDGYKCSNCGHFTCSEPDLEDEFEEYDLPLEVTTTEGEKMKIPSMWALKRPNYCKHCGARMDGENNDRQ